MTTSQLHEFARLGAEARLKAIVEEQQSILRAFPGLVNRATPARRASSSAAASAPSRTRKDMSPAQRTAVGERMRAYWAKRRREKAGPEAPDTQSASDASPTPAKQPSKMSPGRHAQAEKMRAYWAARRAATAGRTTSSGRSSKARKGRKADRKK